MESLLFLIPLLACPLAMAAMGAIGWLWAKASWRTKDAGEPRTTSTPERPASSSEVATERA